MHQFVDLIQNSQPLLVKRILYYARLYGYSEYASPLKDAWTTAINGLSHALIEAVRTNADTPQEEGIPAIRVGCDFSDCPMAAFGVSEARKHRRRGVSQELFLSLLIYYRQTYLDVIEESAAETQKLPLYRLWILRFFDYNEIAYVHEWSAPSRKSRLTELQAASLALTNEKNKYQTIFESFPNPAVVADDKHNCVNLNFAAQKLLYASTQSPGSASPTAYPTVHEVLPWLMEDYMAFYVGSYSECSVEKAFTSPILGKRYLLIKFRRILDASDKFSGTIIILSDLTEIKNYQSRLRQMSFHDQLTGLYNRTYLKEELIRLSSGRFNPVGFLSIDVDGLKLVNDNLGHTAGDSLLVHVGQILKKSVRKNDVLIRMGGDEFGVLMPSGDVETAERVCTRVRKKTEEYNRTHSGMPISMSIGCASGNLLYSGSFTEIMKEADSRMYVEKQLHHSCFAETFREWLGRAGISPSAAGQP